MRRSSIVLVLVCALSLLGAVRGDEKAGEAACACKLEELQSLKTACQKQANELQKHIDTLKGDLAASSSKSTDTSKELSAALDKLKALQSELTTTQGKLSSLQEELSGTQSALSSTQGKLKSTESSLAKAQEEVKAAKESAKSIADQGSTCKRTLRKVESQLSEHAAHLAELKAVEDALLPVWLSRKVDSSFKYASEQWQQLQESDVAAQVASKVGPHWEQLLQATKPAREVAAEYISKGQDALNKLPVAETIAAAKEQVANIEHELKTVVTSVAASQPALSALSDPVFLQLAVYSIMGLPMLLLFVVFASVYGGAGKSSGTGAGAAGKAGGGKKATAAVPGAGKKGAAGGKAKAALQQTPAGKKGKAVRDGADVLYTP